MSSTRWAFQSTLDFPGTVYGISRGMPAREMMTRQSQWFGEHRDDTMIG